RRRAVERGRSPPEALVERRRVDGRVVERVEPDVDDAERRSVPVPDLRERRAAVGRLVQTGVVGLRRQACRADVAGRQGEAAAVSAPTEFCAMSPVRYVQVGSAARASSVRQTPPPETPTHMRQFPATHVGAITIAVTRLAVVFVAPENASTPGCTDDCCGPYE